MAAVIFAFWTVPGEVVGVTGRARFTEIVAMTTTTIARYQIIHNQVMSLKIETIKVTDLGCLDFIFLLSMCNINVFFALVKRYQGEQLDSNFAFFLAV